MKASEMTKENLAKATNDEIAQLLDFISIAFLARKEHSTDNLVREAAARLRKPTPVDDDLLKMARDIDKLRAKLKVAEDALEKLQTICKETEYVYGRVICDNALAAIRKEGGES